MVHHPREVVTHVDEDVQNSKLSVHPLSTRDASWMEPTDVWCWHCCHPFDSTPVCVPDSVTFDSEGEKKYMVFGNFCSLRCAKTHIMSQQTFATNKQLMLLNSMAVDVYQSPIPIPTAPPRICLERFGGSMSIEEFRGSDQVHITCTSPPFRSADVVVSTFERKSKDDDNGTREGDDDILSHDSQDYNTTWNVRDIRRPPMGTCGHTDGGSNRPSRSNGSNGSNGSNESNESNGDPNDPNGSNGSNGPNGRSRSEHGGHHTRRGAIKSTENEGTTGPRKGLRKFLSGTD